MLNAANQRIAEKKKDKRQVRFNLGGAAADPEVSPSKGGDKNAPPISVDIAASDMQIDVLDEDANYASST